MKRAILFALVLAAIFLGGRAGQAHASTAAGDYIDVTSLTGTRTATLSYQGFFSCTEGSDVKLTVIGTDTADGLTRVDRIGERCPSTGVSFNRTLTAPVGESTWGSSVLLNIAMTREGVLTVIADDTLEVVNNQDVDVTVHDALTPQAGGALTIKGTISCLAGETTATLYASASQVAAGGGTITGAAMKTLPCPDPAGTSGPYSLTITPAGEQAFQPLVVNYLHVTEHDQDVAYADFSDGVLGQTTFADAD